MTISTVMIVDDCSTMRTLMRRMLLSIKSRLTVFEARDGAHALTLFDQVSPQIILLDWDMPGTSGIDVLKRIKIRLSDVVVGMVTANYSTAQRKLARELGALFLIAKPFTHQDVRAHLAPYLLNVAKGALRPSNLEQERPTHQDFRSAIRSAINGSVRLPVELTITKNAQHELNGSTGVVASMTDGNDTPILIISMDWSLCTSLHDALAGQRWRQNLTMTRSKRASPDMRENIREVVNIVRGACQLAAHQPLQFDALTFRGDGQLRHEHWQQLLASNSFHEARVFSASVKIEGIGGGQLTIRILSQVH